MPLVPNRLAHWAVLALTFGRVATRCAALQPNLTLVASLGYRFVFFALFEIETVCSVFSSSC